MADSITPALISGAVLAVGWFVSNSLTRRAETKRRIAESNMKHCEKQIEEFYGPMFNLVHQIFLYNHVEFSLLESPEANDQLTERHRETIEDFFCEEYFVPLHRQINEVLKAKLYLVEGTSMPDSVYAYLRHANQESVQRTLWKRFSIGTSYVQGIEFPDALYEDIERDFKKVMDRYENAVQDLRARA